MSDLPSSLRTGRWLLAMFLSLPLALVHLSGCGASDLDQDGYSTEEGDCDDSEPNVHPGAAEVCDYLDNDCDGPADEGVSRIAWPNFDGDEYGDNFGGKTVCSLPARYLFQSGDCDDTNPAIYPGAEEVCDGVDNNCDSMADEGLTQTVWPDMDGDGYGYSSGSIEVCSPPEGYVLLSGDCNDTNPLIHPGAPEVCDGLDNDCDGVITGQSWYLDIDGDGHGLSSDGRVRSCLPPEGYSRHDGDCDNRVATIHPLAPERCNGVDDDCDGQVDDEVAQLALYPDGDLDGFGDEGRVIYDCKAHLGLVETGGDCDDDDPDLHPGAADKAADGIDADCGGTDGPEPHVGYPDSTFPSIQVAIDAAPEGSTVWVGPGIYYEHQISFHGRPLRLASSHTADRTWIEGGGAGTVLEFKDGEDLDSRVQGFTLSGGERAGKGGGVRIVGSSPTLSDCIVYDNHTSEGGSGLYLEDSAARLERLRVQQNQVTSVFEELVTPSSRGEGVGLYLLRSDAALVDCVIEGNVPYGFNGNESMFTGGGIGLFLDQSDPVLEGCSILEHSGTAVRGGGLYLRDSSPTLTGCTIRGNRVFNGIDFGESSVITYEGHGGGLYLEHSRPTLTGCTLSDNRADGDGGGLYLTESDVSVASSRISDNGALSGGGLYVDHSSGELEDTVIAGNFSTDPLDGGGGGHLYQADVTLRRCVIEDNEVTGAMGYGAGLLIESSSAHLDRCIVRANTVAGMAGQGGGLYLSDSTMGIDWSVIAGNVGGGVVLESTGSTVISHSILTWNMAGNVIASSAAAERTALKWCDLYNPSTYGENHNLPALDSSNLTEEPGFLAYDEAGLPVDLHLASDSVLVNAGDPEAFDVDGSRADLGIYSGAAGDGWDRDGDGVPDWFWPGELEDAPTGFDPADYDCDDLDPAVAGATDGVCPP